MKFLVIGRGSMGKRRIRDLKSLGYKVDSWDIKDKKKRPSFGDYDAIVVSTPPDQHNQYIELAIDNGVPVFVEASVILRGLPELNEINTRKNVLIAPSCTMRFHPLMEEIREVMEDEKVLNFTYRLGQHLSDWHPNEKTFYAFKKKTGGAREMVAFVLTWMTDMFGFPEKITGLYGKSMNWEIDDTYAFSMDFGKIFGNVMIDVVSRPPIRKLELWSNQGYHWWNFKVSEEIYLDEIKAFISAVKGEKEFPNTLDDNIKVLKLLNEIEK